MLIDIIFLILIIIACIKGYKKGFIVAIFSFAALFIGLAAALKLSVIIANHLQNINHGYTKWIPFISFAIVFITAVLLVRIVAKLLQKTIETILLGWVNRLGGIIVYTLLYTITLSIFLFYAEKVHLIGVNTTWASVVYPYIKSWGPKAINEFAQLIPFFKDMFGQLEDFFNEFSKKISAIRINNPLNWWTVKSILV